MATFATLPSTVTAKVEPFTLHIPEDQLAGFKALLKASPIGPQTYENQSSQYGVTREWLANAKHVWLNEFDWRASESRINSFPNFMVTVKDPERGDLIPMHFTALFSTKSDAIPLMLMHGWPGSFLEFLPMMDILRQKYTPDTLPFHFIVPSMIGFTLSGGPPLDKHCSLADTVRILHQFMLDLGFGSSGYIAHGGDLGGFFAPALAVASEECKAVHVNLVAGRNDLSPAIIESLSAEERAHMERSKAWFTQGSAYSMEHATRPGTVGLALSSSPLALLAWIGEKFLDWPDPRYPLDLNTILTSVSLYWFTNCYARGIYMYKELRKNSTNTFGGKAAGYSYFPHEIICTPVAWAKAQYPDIICYTHDKGGHFPALEQPELLLGDLEDFVGKVAHLFKQ